MMKPHRALLALPALLVVTACASTAAKLPDAPDGPGQPINSPAAIAALSRVSAPADPDEARRREHERAVLFLPEPETVRVPFAFASAVFEPSPDVAERIATLAETAARIEARGRTHGVGGPVKDQEMARRRAESARRYLVSHGANPETIAVTYRADVERVSDDQRRVDLVFWPELMAAESVR